MKHPIQLFHALLLKRQGFCFSKAWQLAGFNVRHLDYRNEVILFLALCVAYTFVGWNDAEAEYNALGYEYASSVIQKNKAEKALIDMLSGKPMAIDATSWTQCYASTVMGE